MADAFHSTEYRQRVSLVSASGGEPVRYAPLTREQEFIREKQKVEEQDRITNLIDGLGRDSLLQPELQPHVRNSPMPSSIRDYERRSDDCEPAGSARRAERQRSEYDNEYLDRGYACAERARSDFSPRSYDQRQAERTDLPIPLYAPRAEGGSWLDGERFRGERQADFDRARWSQRKL